MEKISASPASTQLAPVQGESHSNRVLDSSRSPKNLTQSSQENRLSPGAWLRAVEDFRAPFGFDKMPTVWG